MQKKIIVLAIAAALTAPALAYAEATYTTSATLDGQGVAAWASDCCVATVHVVEIVAIGNPNGLGSGYAITGPQKYFGALAGRR